MVLATDGPTSPAGFVGISTRIGLNGLTYQRAAHGIGSLTLGTNKVTVTVTRPKNLAPVVTVYLADVQHCT